MPIIFDQWNGVYIGGRKGRKFEIRFCPHDAKAPWSIHSRRSNGYYFKNLREVLCFAAGRNFIEPHLIDKYQAEVMAAIEQIMTEK